MLRLALLTLLSVHTANAALGPENVFVIAAGNITESMDLAKEYMNLRAIPSNRLCEITGIGGPTWPSDALTYAQYKDVFFPQIEACVDRSGAADELVAFVLMRGLPRRVYGATPSNTTSSRLSLAAMLSLWRSTCVGGPAGVENNCDGAVAGAPMYAQRNYNPIKTWPYAYQPVNILQQNTTCKQSMMVGYSFLLSALQFFDRRWLSPFYYDALQQLPGPPTKTFPPGFTRVRDKTKWVPALVTALDGYTYSDALRLVRSGMQAEAAGPASWLSADARFVLMHGPHPTGPREELSFQYPYVANQTCALLDKSFPHTGFNCSRQVQDVKFATNEHFGGPIAAFFVGTAQLNHTVENNTYVNGTLVDNLTSFGCMPRNFNASGGHLQVAVSRWIEKGVGGAHGTTDEPNDGTAFPDRMMLLDYIKGASLAEAYLQRIPYAGWRNLVIGDALTQPYCPRPTIAARWNAGDASAVDVVVSAPPGVTAEEMSVGAFADGVRIADVRRSDRDASRWTVRAEGTPGDTTVSVLVVAEVRYGAGPGVAHCAVPVKGWATLRV